VPELGEKTKQVLVIEGRLPSRNEADNSARAHWSRGAKYKRNYTEDIHWLIIAKRIKPIQGKADICVSFFERDYKRDDDNVLGGGLKYIMDALVNARIIHDDGPKYVNLLPKPVQRDKLHPRIEIEIIGEVGK
jgi:Holliday junction resolvase RusA-like endonuclease